MIEFFSRFTISKYLGAAYLLGVAILLGISASASVQTIGSDGTSYLSVAQHYADGHWKEAVNGYWSPFISWLIAPFAAAGMAPEVAYRILIVACALAILLLGQLLVSKYAKNPWLGTFIYQATILPLLFNAVQTIVTPDLFVALWVLGLAVLLSRNEGKLEDSRRGLVLIGLYGALGFFVKAVLLPVFVASLVVWFLFLARAPRLKLRARIKRLILPVSALLLAASLWIIPLSLKFDQLTLGSSAKISLAYVGPNASGHQVINGLIPPPNIYAASPWEDPTKHAYTFWNPLGSLNDAGFYLDYVFTTNIPGVTSVLQELSPFIVGFLWLTVILLLTGKVERRARPILTAAALVSVVIMLAYTASQIIGGRRYLWGVFVLSNVSIAVLAGCLAASVRGRMRVAVWSMAAVLPIVILLNWYELLFPAWKDTTHTELTKLGETISDQVPARSRFAANSFVASAHVAYTANLLGYGTTQPGLSINDPLVQSALKQNGIQYYFYIDDERKPADMSSFNVVYSTEVEYGDTLTGLPFGTHKAYLVKLQ